MQMCIWLKMKSTYTQKHMTCIVGKVHLLKQPFKNSLCLTFSDSPHPCTKPQSTMSLFIRFVKCLGSPLGTGEELNS